jgi:hypothetical protein
VHGILNLRIGCAIEPGHFGVVDAAHSFMVPEFPGGIETLQERLDVRAIGRDVALSFSRHKTL